MGGVTVGCFLTDGKVKMLKVRSGPGQECEGPRIERELGPTSGGAERHANKENGNNTELLSQCHTFYIHT